mmetsp:Transcript_12723/g.36883  ORF Transcript_12723/g.36883 Transcript_12723/m.36883 type:complete len:158 (-) Transcript_12723:222-695(-)
MVPWHSVSAAVQAGEGLGRGQAIRAVMLAAALEAAAVSSEGVGGDAGLDLERGQWAKEEGGSIINQVIGRGLPLARARGDPPPPKKKDRHTRTRVDTQSCERARNGTTLFTRVLTQQSLRLCSGRARRSVFDSRSPVHQVRLIAEEVAWTEELLLAF